MTVLTAHQFATLMQPFNLKGVQKIAVGVSGGADSLCLTLFLADWAKQHQIHLTAITVNHNLRDVAAEEAEQVHHFLKQRQIEHIILTNHQPVPETGLEAYAREIRYHLIADYCQKENIQALFVAHHASDQAETFLLRLSKKSGLTGLKAMSGETNLNGLRLCRPFLTLSKEIITNTLMRKNMPWIEDEMNQNPAYTRVQWRQFLPTLKSIGVSPETISIVTKRLARADMALEEYANDFIQKNVWIDFRGFARIPIQSLQKLPDEIQIRVLQKLIQLIGQSKKPLSLKSIEELYGRLPCSASLGECVFIPHKTGLYLAKENRFQPKEKHLPANTPTKWDRFILTPQKPCIVRAGMPIDKIENIPFNVQKTFPAVFIQKELEKEIQIDYKEKNDSFIQIQFITQLERYNQE